MYCMLRYFLDSLYERKRGTRVLPTGKGALLRVRGGQIIKMQEQGPFRWAEWYASPRTCSLPLWQPFCGPSLRLGLGATLGHACGGVVVLRVLHMLDHVV